MSRTLFTLLILTSFVQAQPYGMSARPSFKAFNNDKLPPNASVVSGSWSTTVAFSNLTFLNPMGIAQVPGLNTMVVWEREGRVYSFAKSSTTSTKKLMLDIHTRVQGWDDSGLMGLAFHPDYVNNHYVFLYYTWVTPGTVTGDMNNRPPTAIDGKYHDRLVRYTVNANGVMDPASETLFIDQVGNSVWHNGGGLFFHPDNGFLYWTDGDDASGGTQQTITNTLQSGVFRIDVDRRGGSISHAPPRKPDPSGSVTQNYFIPNDNPFVGVANALEEYFCLGLRSPHRMTIDSVSKRIFIGDVGQGDREEVDIIEANESGLNFQWDRIEGLNGNLTQPYIGTDRSPVIDYPHAGGEGCIIGGYVYRGKEFPQLTGKYLFGDNLTGHIYYLDESSTPASRVYMCDLPFGPGPNSGGNYTGLSSFGVDADNELYLCQLSSLGGKIYKLSSSGPPPRPMPTKLSDTGVLSDLASVTPVSGFVAYDVNTPLWSDGAHKQRWFAIPDGKSIGYAPSGEWSFPNGSVFVKHFDLPTDARDASVLTRLETRVLVRDDTGYVYGGSYKWRADHSDADLVSDAVTENIATIDKDGNAGSQPWFFPGRQDCLTCHTRAAGGVLGLKTKQSHRDHDFGGVTDNQLRAWNHVGYFAPSVDEATLPSLTKLTPITDTNVSVEQRMRSYLDSNCSHCHRPGGVHALWDARIDTPLDDTGIVNGVVTDPLGVTGAHVITPGDLASSIMHKRLSAVNSTTVKFAMPPVAKNVVDANAVALLEQWIAQVIPPAAKPLPSPWKHQDIGNVGAAGSAGYVGGIFSVQGAGDDIWNTADGLHFVYQDLTGDGTLMARVITQTNTNQWAKAGVMIRESLAPESKHAMTIVTPQNGVCQQGRDATGGDSYYEGVTNGETPKLLRIQRKGNVFISSSSDDGSTWSELNRHTIAMAAKVKIGLCVTSHVNGTLSTVGFDNVHVFGSVPFAISGAPLSTLVRAGNPAQLEVSTIGEAPASYQWRLNSAPIAGASDSAYAIHSTKLKQGGSYTVLVGGKLLSNPATLAVVDAAIGNLNVVANGTASLTVPSAGAGIIFSWSKDGNALPSSSKTSGTNTAKLIVKSFTAADEGDYSCTASAFGLSETLGPYHLHLLKKPSITNAAPGNGIVSGFFSWQLTSDEPATTFDVVGLPPGLSYDAKTNRITGTPDIAGDYTIKITPINAAGTGAAQSFTLHVDAFPLVLAGRYTAIMERAAGVNDELGGYVDLTITSTGGLSGRLYNAATSYPLSGRVLASTNSDPVYAVTLARGTLAPVVLSLSFSKSNAALTGTATVSNAVANIVGRHQGYLFTGRLDGGSIVLNAALSPVAPALGDVAQPQGTGWLRLTYTGRSGSVIATGQAADGSVLSFSGIVGNNFSTPMRCVMHNGKGSIQGTPAFAQPAYLLWPDHVDLTMSGTLDWRKIARASSTDYSYATINEPLSVNGARHQVSAGFTLLGNADVANNALIAFTDAGIDQAAQFSSLAQTFRLTTASKALFGNATINPCSVSLSFDATKGTFSGGFKLKDGSTTRNVSLQGILVNNVGKGFFTLPQLPLLKTSPVLSGAVEVHSQP